MGVDLKKLEKDIIYQLKTVFDPEIPVDIYELGLVYEIKIDDDLNIFMKMTLTSPGCPVAGSLPGDVRERVKALKDVNDVFVELVWDPPWDKDMMSDEAKFELGFM